MKILFICPMWGNSDKPVDFFMEMVKKAGYDGIETSLPNKDDLLWKQTLKALKDFELHFVAQHHETANPDPELHLAEYGRRLENLVEARPLLVNTQTGKDWFSFEQNKRLITAARQISEKSGVKIVHETHRGKFSFNARVTADFLRDDPELRIAADFSHWCVVSESFLEDQEEAVSLAISRTDHIHARVGYPEGPQISDPRAPEWKRAMDTHIGWWDRIVENHRKKGTAVLTIAPEFGPPLYMPVLPYTGMPITNQWDVNVYMMNLLRERYQ
jgi:sugar phosphate isomerase/epimerase